MEKSSPGRVELLTRHQLDPAAPDLGVGQLHEVSGLERAPAPIGFGHSAQCSPAACSAATRSLRASTPTIARDVSTTRYSLAGMFCTASSSVSPVMSVCSVTSLLTGRARSLTGTHGWRSLGSDVTADSDTRPLGGPEPSATPKAAPPPSP